MPWWRRIIQLKPSSENSALAFFRKKAKIEIDTLYFFYLKKSMNRVDRLVAIILFLQSRKLVRAKDVAEHFEISMRTVYRDVKALCEAGVPVAAEAGEGYSLVDGYHLPPIMFTAEETSALFLGSKFVEKQTDASLVKNAQSALAKIRSALPQTTLDYLEKLHDSTEIFLRNRQPQAGFRDDVIVAIQDAIANNHVLEIEYFSPRHKNSTKRDIEPLAMLHYSHQWHLIAFCRLRQDFRDFRTDRLKHILSRDETFSPRKDFVLKDYIENYFKPQGSLEIKVKFDQQLAQTIRERYAYGLIDEEPVKNGVIMTFVVPDLKWVVNWLLSLDTRVEVISPVSLKKDLLQQAQALVLHYQKK